MFLFGFILLTTLYGVCHKRRHVSRYSTNGVLDHPPQFSVLLVRSLPLEAAIYGGTLSGFDVRFIFFSSFFFPITLYFRFSSFYLSLRLITIQALIDSCTVFFLYLTSCFVINSRRLTPWSGCSAFSSSKTFCIRWHRGTQIEDYVCQNRPELGVLCAHNYRRQPMVTCDL